MKHLFKSTLIFCVLSTQLLFAQIQKHAFFSAETPKNATVGDVVEIKFNAKIDPTWHLYSNVLKVEGPQPTEFNFKKSNTYELVGKPKAVGFHDLHEEVWGGNTTVAENKASFVQKIKILKENPTVEVTINFQTCQTDGLCTMGEEDIKASFKAAPKPADEANEDNKAAQTTTTDSSATEIAQSQPTTIAPAATATPATVAAETTPEPAEEESLWSFLLACFLGGLASIFMPCIYPIMPMTVSFFTKQENGRSKAMLYGISIVAIYTLLGVLVSRLGGPEAANFISTHWLPNLIFFVVFIAFGLSFLGLFEIVLPSSFVNNVDQKADKGGLIGIFFMALTLVVVSFSCTAPIAGTLLILASKGSDFMRPILGMMAFSLPLGVVFTLLALFPGWLKSLPKSGGWLNEFKVVFGILEFALALKFLSNIDLAYHWETLDREIFLAIWIVLFAFLGFYILGKIRMDKDTDIKAVTIPRFLISTAIFSFVVYMIPGMFGAPLKGLSGWLPPTHTQDFYLSNNGTAATSTTAASTKKAHVPLGLPGFVDYDEAIAEAKKTGKPVFIDFTGHNCANCRKMEGDVWSKPEIFERLKNDVIIASLYVDDKEELPVDKQIKSAYDGKTKTTVGAKNLDFQITKFNANAQPLYCLVTPDGQVLTKPVGYTSADEFTKFLDEGIKKFGEK